MKITEKQQKYLIVLMDNSFWNFRKLILKEKYNVDSTKDLQKDTASEIIEKLVNNDVNFIQECKEIALKSIWQQNLF